LEQIFVYVKQIKQIVILITLDVDSVFSADDGCSESSTSENHQGCWRVQVAEPDHRVCHAEMRADGGALDGTTVRVPLRQAAFTDAGRLTWPAHVRYSDHWQEHAMCSF